MIYLVSLIGGNIRSLGSQTPTGPPPPLLTLTHLLTSIHALMLTLSCAHTHSFSIHKCTHRHTLIHAHTRALNACIAMKAKCISATTDSFTLSHSLMHTLSITLLCTLLCSLVMRILMSDIMYPF